MPIEIGRIVRSQAGRDKGTYLVVLSSDERTVTVADGKERPLERPKTKNYRHVVPTDITLSENDMTTNRGLRKALALFAATNL